MKVESAVISEVQEAVAQEPELSEAIPSLSVLVPITKGHENLRTLYLQMVKELTPREVPFEVIYVLDGPSFPQAERQLRELQASYSGVRVYRLNRAFGEAAALQTASAHARGRTILTMAPYFQFVPGAITKILDTLNDGYDLVVARRHPRVNPWLNQLQSWVFHLLTNWVTGVRLWDITCGLRAMKAEVLQAIPLYGELHLFVPLLAHKHGFRIAEVPLPQNPADAGRRVYPSGLYLRRLLDILTIFFLFKFTNKPLRFFGVVGAGLFGSGFLITSYLTTLRLLHVTALANRPLLLLGVLLMVMGFQTASLGLIGEIIVFTHANKSEDYVVETILE
jgi:glycosyltransferase involved in cell wall biosynthesis